MSFSKRLKAMIKEERFTQAKFADDMGVSRSAIEKYLSGENQPTAGLLMSISQHSVFRKYTMWLLSGTVEPDAGQVCPAFSTQELCGLTTGENDIQKEA
ncbi:MAG TPA: transcriptional regulator [Vibrio sp.]|nr:transcriptional regulator [Vibrio sp.]